MGIAVSASEKEGLRLLCDLAPKYDCKLREREAIAVCQWARRRGHFKELKDVFWQQTWKNIGADLWDSVQEGQPEAGRIAPIYGTLNKIMIGLHGEVEAKKALQKALGIDGGEESSEDNDPRHFTNPAPTDTELYPLTEAEKAALGGPSDSLPPYTGPIPEEAPFVNPTAPSDPADVPLPMNKDIPNKTYPDLSKWRKNKEEAYKVPSGAHPPRMNLKHWSDQKFFKNKKRAKRKILRKECTWKTAGKWNARKERKKKGAQKGPKNEDIVHTYSKYAAFAKVKALPAKRRIHVVCFVFWIV